MVNFKQTFSVLVITTIIILVQTAIALQNGLAQTPPMGWLAWERFVCETDCKQYPDECIDGQLFYEMGKRLVDDGFKKVGYEYVNIDDCWSMKERNSTSGQLIPDPYRFSELSIPQLADNLHELGLKLGIYGDCGTKTCQLFPGQLKYENSLKDNYFAQDAQLFADWGIDSFKFDGCYMEVENAFQLCPPMGKALNHTGRPMLFSCSWPAYENDANITTDWKLVVERCNLWRSFGDIEDSWSSVLNTIDWFVAKQNIIVKYHGPGHWFDADQLVIGDFGLSHDQEIAHMAIWCIWSSPLYMSNDLRTINKDSSKILRNKWAIAINQDRLGVFGMMVKEYREVQVFVKPVAPIRGGCPSYAIVYLFRRTLGNSRLCSFKLHDLISELHKKLEQNGLWNDWSECANLNSTFSYYDIFDDFYKFPDTLNLNSSNLNLRVNPSGARMVQLVRSS